MIPCSRPSLGPEELQAVGRVFDSGWLGLGSTTFDFENALKEYLGCEHVVTVNTGTSALHLALDGLGVGPGDEVIVPSLTFAASVQAILAAGAVPVFCEAQPDNLLIDLDDLKKRITDKTRAVMPVHYCGSPCDMDSLLGLAEQHNFHVVEDAAHAFGSTLGGRKIGSFGHTTCFSFDPIKTLTCGEGGAITTDSEELAETLRCKRNLGIDKETWVRYQNKRSWFYEVVTPGYRYHMPNFCAAVGLEQLKKVDSFISRRRTICRRYQETFASLSHVQTLKANFNEAAPFTYIIKVDTGRRDAFMAFLKERGVGTGIHYIANHLHPLFEEFVRAPLPETDRLWQQIVTLPLYSTMTDEEVETVIQAVTDFDQKKEG